MKKTELIRILSGLGISTSGSTGYIQIPNLKSLNLTSDGNQVLNKYSDYISFDFDNELIGIKEYDVVGISAMINMSMATVKDNVINSGLQHITHSDFPFRKYCVGDVVYFVDRKTLKRNTSLDNRIVNIDNRGIIMEKNVPNDYNNYYVCYASGNEFATATLREDDNRLAIKYTPRTKFITDIYLTFDSICGFTFTSSVSTLI